MPSKSQGVSEIPHICYASGIRYAVISPGSRNAPLVVSFVSHPNLNCISITDERSAAYYALGIAQQLQKPVVLICTSGTAMANYAPAMAEAFYLKIPLIALTADRPPQWIDQNDGQTIQQHNFFSNVVKKSFTTPLTTLGNDDLWYFRRIINEAIHTTILENPGPVHVNIPLKEPLYEALPSVSEPPPVLSIPQTTSSLLPQSWPKIVEMWEKHNKKLIISGFGNKNPELSKLLENLVKDDKAMVMAENLSNISAPNIIDTPERFMAMADSMPDETFRPDLLITLGGAIISKRVKKYLRLHPPAQHWHVDPNELYTDTFQSLSYNIRMSPESFFRELNGKGQPISSYVKSAKDVQQKCEQKHGQFLTRTPFSDLKAYEMIIRHLPQYCNLHLANSTPVRYAQLFPSHKHISYFSNRGTSGIDGCLSTAAGAAMVTSQLNVVLLGDLAFIYDSNGLWNNHLPVNLRIIVIDNGGGNIFKLIETGPEAEKIRPYIETPHLVNIKNLCKAFNTEYLFADDVQSLENILIPFFKPNKRPVVLHIKTPGDVSADIFKKYFQTISKK